MHRLIQVAFLLGICACTGPVSEDGTVLRSLDRPIYSSAAFDPTRLEGQWSQVADFRARNSSECPAGAVAFLPDGPGLVIRGRLCLNGRTQQVSGKVGHLGSGRLSVNGMEDWWVLWVDSGYRTLAIGTPSGRFGFILDRGVITPDRMTAAEAVFDFNGYPLSALGPV